MQIFARDAGARQQREQQQLRAGAGRTLRHARARRARPTAISLKPSGLPGATRMPCSRRAKAITTASCNPGASATAVDIGLLVIAVETVQMDCRDHHFATHQPPQSFLASFREAREAAAAFAQRPFQQRILTAADDRRRSRMRKNGRRNQARRHPAVERGARKQPAPGHLGAGHRAVRDELIELALGQSQIVRRLVGGQQVRHRHRYANDAAVTEIDHNGTICTRCLQMDIPMPADVSALQLVLTGDPALFAIVRLSLIVSLSAVVLAALIGMPLGRAGSR